MLSTKSLDALEKLAGLPMPQNSRDMTAYDGKEFKCICGEVHNFNATLNDRNYVASGANATMIVHCPYNRNDKTLITTKYKFIVIFKGFESLAGYREY
jgi:hypothetical protein